MWLVENSMAPREKQKGRRATEIGRRKTTKKSARCYATRGGGVGVHLVLSQRERERERVTSPYADIKEDSKSEQMAFIVVHRLCRAVRQCTDHTLRKREKHTRHYNGRFASRRSADATSSERGKQFGK